jgi:phosphoglycerol transferase MdoB-like AlkP superfamily enzyme
LNKTIKSTKEFLFSIKSEIISFFTQKDRQGSNKILNSVRFYSIWSFVLELVIESLCRHSVIDGVLFLLTSFFVFAWNALLIFLTLLPVFFMKRKIFYLSFLSIIWLGLGITDCIITQFRVTPFSMIDILNLRSVFPIISIYLKKWQIGLIILAFLVVLSLLIFIGIRSHTAKRNWKKGILSLIVACLLLIFGYIIGNNTHLISRKFSSLSSAYEEYGFPYCFTISVVDRGISTPTEYSSNKMDEILDALNSCDDSLPDQYPNIIFVQLESFFNVNDLQNIRFSENPIPYFSSLLENEISGYLTVPVVGAGTVNTEFEVLTGMSLDYFGTGEYPYKTALKNYSCETAAYNLKELDYSTHAIHNYQGTFYDRYLVYKNMGFDTFTSLEYMQNIEYNISGAWPKDDILTEEILKALSSTEGPDFISTISVQGHGKYPPNKLPDEYEPSITAEFIDGTIEGGLSDINALIYYINQLSEMDQFIQQLVEAIREWEEDTILVFYGDHLPSLSIINEDLKNGNIYQTNYVILANFELDKTDSGKDLYAYQLSSEVFNLVGIHNGLLTKLHQNYAENSQYQEWLYDLEYDMIGYDVLGNISPRYVYGGNLEYYPKVTDMQMGTVPIILDRYEYLDGYLRIYGSGFTEWSRPIIDGKFVSSYQLEDGYILIPYVSDEAVHTLAVAQIADNGIELSRTEEVFFSIISEIETDQSRQEEE